MERQFINPEGLRRPGAYTPVVVVSGGRTIHVSGQVPIDEEGRLVGGADLTRQAEQVFRNLGLALKGAGATFADVIKINTYVVGYRPEHRSILHEIRTRYFSNGSPPASTMVGVTALAVPDYLIEIEAVAVTA